MAERILDALASLPTLPTYLALMLLSAVENVFPPVPADVAVALGAFLAQRGELSAPLLGILCWLANTASAAWIYALARSRGPSFFSAGWGRRLMPEDDIATMREAVRRHGGLGIFLTRFLPGVRAAVLPFAGAFGLSPARALLPAAGASAIWYAFLVVAGSMLGSNWAAVQAVVGDANRVLGLGAVAAIFVFGVWWWRRKRAA